MLEKLKLKVKDKQNEYEKELSTISEKIKKLSSINDLLKKDSAFMDITPKEALEVLDYLDVKPEKKMEMYMGLIDESKDKKPAAKEEEKEEVKIPEVKSEEIEEEPEPKTIEIDPKYQKYVDKIQKKYIDDQSDDQKIMFETSMELIKSSLDQDVNNYYIAGVEANKLQVADNLNKLFRGEFTPEEILPMLVTALGYNQIVAGENVDKIEQELQQVEVSQN